MAVGYDKYIKVNGIDARIYNVLGQEVNKLKKSDILDYSAFHDFSLYEDNRMKYFEMKYPDYPYTVSYEIEMDISSLIYMPSWQPLDHFRESVESSVLKVIVPENMEIKYKSMHVIEPVKIETIDGKKIYTWEAKNIKAIEREPSMPSLKELMTYVKVSPLKYELEHYECDLSSWQDYGKWINQLNEGMDELPEATINKIKELTSKATSEREKIRILYDFLQSNTRYISVQLGIGGFQPFPASFVAEHGYGDCKALSNYMHAILKTAGIQSYYTLVSAGTQEREILKDFPSNQFNHAILCVPNQGDTVWLECTSQDCPFGYVGTFTDNRHVLLATETGGKLVRTPAFTQRQNLMKTEAEVELTPEGNAVAKVRATFHGQQYEAIREVLDIGQDKQKKWLYDNIDIPNFDVKSFAFYSDNEPVPTGTANLEFSLKRFCSTSGKRIFFQPNLMNKTSKLTPPTKPRKFPFEKGHPYIDKDSIVYIIPAGFHMEYIPEDLEINSEFGTYHALVKVEQGKITYLRSISGTKGEFPAEKYKEYLDFVNKVANADQMKLVLVKST